MLSRILSCTVTSSNIVQEISERELSLLCFLLQMQTITFTRKYEYSVHVDSMLFYHLQDCNASLHHLIQTLCSNHSIKFESRTMDAP